MEAEVTFLGTGTLKKSTLFQRRVSMRSLARAVDVVLLDKWLKVNPKSWGEGDQEDASGGQDTSPSRSKDTRGAQLQCAQLL